MQFYGQFDPPVDKFIYERYFSNRKVPGFFIECGAFDGQMECSCKFFEETLGWTGLNIEPSPPIFEQLKKNRPNSININAALSNYDGKSVFKQAVHPHFGELCTNGSLKHTDTHLSILDEMGCTLKEYEVCTISWSSLISKYNVKEIDLMVLDVEGHELTVIEGMLKNKVLPRILCIEHGQLGLEPLEQALYPLGYRYDTSSHVNSFFVLTTNIFERLCFKVRKLLSQE